MPTSKDCSAPFSIGVTTDNTNDPHSATNSNRGRVSAD